ncbi:MAG: hypothetical protein RMK35_04415 [Aquificaceae bacterium]|nr:hypothetical protein [Aquificaceae bacterium]MDW8434031.1 hypothetical protein [Aquificaceae bacterium]
MALKLLRGGGLFPLVFVYLLVGLVSCDVRKEKDDKVVIQEFFAHLNKGEYNKVIGLTDSEAKQLMEHLLNDFPPDVTKLIFPNLVLTSVEYDDFLTKDKKNLKAYRVKYNLKVDESIQDEDLKKTLKASEKGEALFYLKDGKIRKIVDIQGNIFVR